MFTGSISQASSGVSMPVQTIVYHSGYQPFKDPNIDDNSNDIAVIYLATPLNFSGNYQLTSLSGTQHVQQSNELKADAGCTKLID